MSLQLEIVSDGGWDEVREEFLEPVHCKITMEHSLVSIQKWESKWKVPFLSHEAFTRAETESYWECMTLTQHVDPMVYKYISPAQARQINDYIADPMTATTITNRKKQPANREIQTAETIYSTMIDLGIPSEYRKWHFNQLMTLIEVRAIKSQPADKMSTKDILAQNRELNRARRAATNSRG